MACKFTEPEILATDDCVKTMHHIHHILQDFNLHFILLNEPTMSKNDNMVCVHWRHNMTTKLLSHFKMREIAI